MENEVRIKNVFWYLYRKKWSIFAAAFLGFLGLWILSSRVWEKEYASTTELYLWNRTEGITDSVLLQMQAGQEVAGDYQYLIQSQVVADEVIEKLSLSYGYGELKNQIHVTNPDGTRMIEVTVYDKTPENAKKIADELAKSSKEHIESLMDSIEVEILMEGGTSYTPVGPDVQRNSIFGALFGAFLSIILILVPYFMSNRIRTVKQAEECLKMEVLGEIPRMKKKETGRKFQKEYKRIRTRLLAKGDIGNVIGIVSCKNKEGKSVVACQLAKSIAKLQKKVLLLDTDTKEKEEDSGVEFFYSEKFREMLEQWRKEYDYVIVDTASMELGTQASVVGGLCDSIVFLLQSDRIDYRLAQKRTLELEKTGSHVVGVILNQMNVREAKEYV